MYDALYWMAYRMLLANGGEKLLGDNGDLAFDAFLSCAPNDAMPVLYFEIPLLGPPRFDLQVCIDRVSLAQESKLPGKAPEHLRAIIDWLREEGNECAGVDFAFDISDAGDREADSVISSPQVIAFTNGCETCDLETFFSCAGDVSAASRYQAAQERVPEGWASWYTGLLPQRTGSPVRLDYNVDQSKTMRYRNDISLLARDLRRMGYEATPLEIEHCASLLSHPFDLNIQLDLLEDGTLGPVLGYNAAFGRLGAAAARESVASGELARIMELVEGWKLADERWRLLEGRCLGRTFKLPDGQGLAVHSAPTFLKVRMTPDALLDAKVYVIFETTFL